MAAPSRTGQRPGRPGAHAGLEQHQRWLVGVPRKVRRVMIISAKARVPTSAADNGGEVERPDGSAPQNPDKAQANSGPAQAIDLS